MTAQPPAARGLQAGPCTTGPKRGRPKRAKSTLTNPAAKETGFWGFGGTAVWAPIPRPVVDTPRRQSRGRLRERRARDAGALLAPRCGAARRAPHVCVPRGPARADTTSSPAADPSRAAAPAPRSLPAAAPKLPGARVSAECLRAPSSRRDG